MITKLTIHACAALRHFRSRNGQSLAEYALILSFISVLSVAVMSVLGPQIRALFSVVLSVLAAARSLL
jgi:Flp pilus assembly pilin Flp